eukprot:8814720-Lingulodinium_polyedra.AAC.1
MRALRSGVSAPLVVSCTTVRRQGRRGMPPTRRPNRSSKSRGRPTAAVLSTRRARGGTGRPRGWSCCRSTPTRLTPAAA